MAIAIAVTVAGCSSGGGSPSSTPTPTPSTSADTTVAGTSPVAVSSDPVPSLVTSPVPGPVDPVVRTITRPAGASKVSGVTCVSAGGGAVTGLLVNYVFNATSYAVQLSGLDGAYGAAKVELPAAQKAYRAFLRAGYPASFPIVKELAAMIMWLKRLYTARAHHDVAATPAIYVGLREADTQFGADAQPSVCSS